MKRSKDTRGGYSAVADKYENEIEELKSRMDMETVTYGGVRPETKLAWSILQGQIKSDPLFIQAEAGDE